jgi:hypothetical protein
MWYYVLSDCVKAKKNLQQYNKFKQIKQIDIPNYHHSISVKITDNRKKGSGTAKGHRKGLVEVQSPNIIPTSPLKPFSLSSLFYPIFHRVRFVQYRLHEIFDVVIRVVFDLVRVPRVCGAAEQVGFKPRDFIRGAETEANTAIEMLDGDF